MIKYISIPYHYYVYLQLVVLAQGRLSATKKNLLLLGEEDGADWCAGEIAGEFMELYLSK